MISIIIPIYNVAPYLERCFDSVLNQTYQDFEVILVDDGSTDNSRDVCQKYVERDFRFSYHYKKNGGVSSARNLGLRLAKGEFVYMMDSDDTIEENCLEWHLEKMKDGMDVVISGYHLVDEKKGKFWDSLQLSTFKRHWTSSEAIAQVISVSKGIHFGMSYLSLFRLSIIRENNLCFDEDISIYEDSLFCIKYFSCCNKIYYENIPLYNYVQRQDSLIHPTKTKLKYSYITGVLERVKCMEFVKQKRLGLKIKLLSKVSLYYAVKDVCQYLSNFEESLEKLRYEDLVMYWYKTNLSCVDRVLLCVYHKSKNIINKVR